MENDIQNTSEEVVLSPEEQAAKDKAISENAPVVEISEEEKAEATPEEAPSV